MKSEEKIETLIKLGMTLDQARTYLTLVQIGPATAKIISEASKISRPDIYRIIPYLQEEGLIETLITRPTCFQAVPVKQVLPIMFNRKTKEQNDLRAKIEELLSDSKKNHTANSQSVDSIRDFIVVPRKTAVIDKIKKALDNARISVCTVTSKKRFSSAIVMFEQEYKEALKRNVRISLCTEEQNVSKEASKPLQSLSAIPGFEVRYFSSAPKAIVSIFDEKQACVMMTADAHLAEAAALWSNNSCFIALAQDYFENKWCKAHPFLNMITELSGYSA